MRRALLLLALAACSSAELTPAPDSGVVVCSATPRIFCDAGAPGPEACTADPGATGSVKLLPTASYPVGCHAVVLNASCEDVEVSCSCDRDDDGGVARWTCSPP
jgi:hypothetical protein